MNLFKIQRQSTTLPLARMENLAPILEADESLFRHTRYVESRPVTCHVLYGNAFSRIVYFLPIWCDLHRLYDTSVKRRFCRIRCSMTVVIHRCRGPSASGFETRSESFHFVSGLRASDRRSELGTKSCTGVHRCSRIGELA
jgi:hypothetical protein